MPGFVIAGAMTGFLVGLTGGGGGALMTPILLLFLGVAPTTAVATDLWFAVVTKLVAARFHWRAGEVDWQVARRLWLGSLPTALFMGILAVNRGHAHPLPWLSTFIGSLVMITALGIMISPALLKLGKRERLAHPESFKSVQPVLTVLVGALLAVCVSLTSIGAGALGSVLLLYLYPLRMKPHRLVATDIVHAIPLAIVAGLAYLLGGDVDLHMLLAMLAGSLPAVIAGSLLAGRLQARQVQVAMALCLLMAAGKILL